MNRSPPVVAPGALVACASSTTFKASWRNPVAQSFTFSSDDKVLAVIVTDEPSLRHARRVPSPAR